jgi:chemotaxis protein CheD
MKEQITINACESYASKDPVIIHTLLGSCVAVCLYDPISRVGGMNHILLPGRPDIKKFDDSARYGINAMDILITMMMKLGGKRDRFIAKAFGGAHVIPEISWENGVGQKIAAFVRAYLKNESIRLVSSDLGGFDVRNIYFHADTGEALLKRRKPKKTSRVIHEEKKQLKEIERKIKEPTDITLFDVPYGCVKKYAN